MLSGFLKLKNHDCVTATDGRNGLELLRQTEFDATILDIAMPEFSGYDVIESLANGGIIKQKIIVLTAVPLSSDQMSYLLKKGVKMILKKPVEPDILMKALTS